MTPPPFVTLPETGMESGESGGRRGSPEEAGRAGILAGISSKVVSEGEGCRSTSLRLVLDSRITTGRRGTNLCRAILLLAVTLPLLCGSAVSGQAKKRSRKPKPQPANPVADSKADVVKAAKEHKTNLEKELGLLEAQLKEASDEVELRKALLAKGLVPRRDLESSERLLSIARALRDTRQTEINETNNLIAEATAAEQLAKLRPMPIGGYMTTAALIRYIGPTRWFLTDIGKVQSFFTERFGHALPVSAFGQTPVHDRLGFDHHESVDVAAHPDSAEGQAIIAYLRSAGISFIAFRQAVPGSATGAHIHIGLPSRKLAR